MNKDGNLKLILASLVGLAAFLVYLPSLGNGFVNWDDSVYVYDNPMISSLNPGFIKWVLTAIVCGNWHPLTMLSLAIDYHFWGLEPMGFHLVNIILHSLNTFLVFLLAHRLFKCCLGPTEVLIATATTSLLFGIHPIHVESVSWISERKDVLYSFFYILSILSYIKYVGGSRIFYTASIASFFLALLCKPMAVTLPAVLLVLDYYPLGRLKCLRKALVEKAPYFILSCVFAAVCIYAQQHSSAMAPFEQYPVQGRISVPISALGFYLYKLILPLKLAHFYPLPDATEYFNLTFFTALLSVIAISACSLLLLKKNRILISAWLFFIVTLSPVLGVLQVGNQAAADRYMYLASIGPFMLAGAGIAVFYSSLTSKTAKTLLMITLCSVCLLLVSKTVSQQSVWKDTISLWSNTLEVSTRRIAIGHYYRGLAYEKSGDLIKAVNDLSEAIFLNTEYAAAYTSRGILFGEMQLYEKAIGDFNKAISLAPEDFNAYLNRGVAYLYISMPEIAMTDFKKTIEFDPKNAKAYLNLGLAYAKLNDRANAIININRAADLGLNEALEYLKGI